MVWRRWARGYVVTARSWISGVEAISCRSMGEVINGGIPDIRNPYPEGNIYTVFDARLANGFG